LFLKISRGIRGILAIALIGGIFSTPASAATPLIAVKPMSLVANLASTQSAQGILVKKSIIYVYGTSAASTSDGFVTAFDNAGTQIWNLALDTGGDDIATAAGLDPFGNIWVAGASAPALDSADPINSDATGALNPDSVTVVPKIPLRGDPNSVTTWLISPSGELLSTFSKDVGRSILVSSVSTSAATISIVGVTPTALGSAGFFIQSTRRGAFGKFTIIGKRDTEINSIVKSGKNLLLLGSSSETLYGKPKAGNRDATAIVFNSTGTFVSILRSYNTGASRSWHSGTSGTSAYLMGGNSVTGTKTEAVLTKFTSNLLPTWTTRFASAGPAVTAESAQVQSATFSSVGSITGIKSWKPSKAQLISLIFDKNGVITQAFSAKGLVSPISATFSAELGVVVLGRGPEGVSIFHALTR
jgi:hypothetical protein